MRFYPRVAAARRRSRVTPPPPPPPPGFITRLELPINVPDRPTLHSAPQKFYGHNFATTDHRAAAILGGPYGNRLVDRNRQPVYTITNKALASNVATITTSGAHTFQTGDRVIIAGVGSPFDGTVTLTGVPTASTITYAKSFTNVSSTSATGTASFSGPNEGNPDWYDENYLPFPKPKSTDGSIPPGLGSYRGTGSFWRDRQLRRANPGNPPGVKDREREVQWAYDHGWDGFFVDSLYRGAAQELEVWDAVRNLGMTGKFDLIPMIDLSGGFKTDTPAQQITQINIFLNRPETLVINGKYQVAFFYPENKDVAWFQAVIDGLAPKQVELTFCYVGIQGSAIYGNHGSTPSKPSMSNTPGYASTYDSVAVRHGWWGERNPVGTGASTVRARGAAYANDTQSDMTPGRSLGYVAPGDERPKSKNTSGVFNHLWNENRATENLRVSYDVVTNGNGLPSTSAPARPDWVQGTTWQDTSEHSDHGPTQNHGFNMLDIGFYYMIKAKTGTFPTIVRDCLYLTHRIQFTSGMTYTSPYLTGTTNRTGSTPAADIIEVLIFATAACTVELTAGNPGTTTPYTVPGPGVYVYNTRPLEAGPAGSISARMTRSGALVPGTSITSPWAVSHTNYSPDWNYRGGSSLRGWHQATAAGLAAVPVGTEWPPSIPDQTHRPIT